MEKFQRDNIKLHKNQPSKSNNNMWDCGSTLYDSFELNSFKRQLDSAIANSSRTLSMPHLPADRQPQPPAPKKSFKISRSLQKFLRSVFKPNNHKSNSSSSSLDQKPKDRIYMVSNESGPVLSTIPQVPKFEFGRLSPEYGSLVRRSASERFSATAIHISCA